MSKEPIKRSAQGVTVTRYVDAWPRPTVIELDGEQSIRLFGAEQARGLRWALDEVIEADGDDK